jgi:hypothetical protein
MIDKELYKRKIEQLSDIKLKELLVLNMKENADIIALAEDEAFKRGIDPKNIQADRGPTTGTKTKKDEGVNWAGVLADILSGLS